MIVKKEILDFLEGELFGIYGKMFFVKKAFKCEYVLFDDGLLGVRADWMKRGFQISGISKYGNLKEGKYIWLAQELHESLYNNNPDERIASIPTIKEYIIYGKELGNIFVNSVRW